VWGVVYLRAHRRAGDRLTKAMIGKCATCGRDGEVIRGLCRRDYQRAWYDRTITNGLVDATPAKAKIAELLVAGWSTRTIAEGAGVSRGAVLGIMRGRGRINQKTFDAICGLDAGAAANRATRRKRVEPARPRRRRTTQTPEPVTNPLTLWVAAELGVAPEQLAAEYKKQRRLPFAARYAELRDHCGLSDSAIALRLGITHDSLVNMCGRYQIKPQPELVAATEQRS
jgi:transcriptional regulator with XRE-family HTH domain